MRYKKLDMNLLAALDILLRTKSVSMAAEEMFITQSAMSNALGRLRDFFSDPLLIQVGRHMELSPLAQTLQDPLRDIFVRVDGSIISSPVFDPQTSDREFSIALSDYSLAVLGEGLTRRLSELAPGVTLHLRPQIAAPERLLERGEIDLLIVPESIAMDSHASVPLFDDRLVVLVSKEFDLDQPFDIDRFSSSRMVVMEPLAGQKSFAVIAMEAAGLHPKKAVTTYSFNSLADLTHGPDRLAVIQEKLALRAVATGGFTILEPPIAFPLLRQTLRWHRHRSRDPGLLWLRNLLVDCATSR